MLLPSVPPWFISTTGEGRRRPVAASLGGGGGGGGGGDAKMGRSLAVKKAGVSTMSSSSLRTRSLGRRARSADGEEGGIVVVAASGSA